VNKLNATKYIHAACKEAEYLCVLGCISIFTKNEHIVTTLSAMPVAGHIQNVTTSGISITGDFPDRQIQ
jgi:ribose/xylose/arabinose/galactoside ABC-type transport system permease subunit